MAVGAHQAVGVQAGAVVPHHFGQVFEIHLVDDARSRRDNAEVVEGRLAPFEELVPLLVTGELLLGVDEQRHARVESVHLHRVIDDQIALHPGIDLERRRLVTRHPHNRRAHGRKIDDGRYPCEVLQDDPSRGEGNFGLLHAGGVIRSEGLDVFVGHHQFVVVAQSCLEQDFDGVRK